MRVLLALLVLLSLATPASAACEVPVPGTFTDALYLRQILGRVEAAWKRQNQVTEPPQVPSACVEILRDGSIRALTVHKSSSNASYDQAALRAIIEASPFPPLPQEWPKASLRILITFRFQPPR